MDTEDKPICVCTINFNIDEGQSLSLRESGFNVGEISAYDLGNELQFMHVNNLKGQTKTKSWNRSCDPLPLRNGVEILNTFLSKGFMEDNFYFVFSDVEGKTECDRNNLDLSETSCLSSMTERHTKRNDSTSTEEYGNGSVFGSPLKLEQIADISLNETSSDCFSTSTFISDQHTSRLVGLPISEAREILSKFCQIKHTKQKPLLKSIVILCDCSGDDLANKTTILLGAHNDVGEQNRKLTTFKVTCGNKKHNLSFLKPLDLTSGSLCPMQCTYKLLEQRDKAKKLNIEAYWSNCHGNSISNLHKAQFSLRITAPFGYKDSPLLKHLGQLKHIMMLCKGLRRGELPNVLSTKQYNAQEHLQDLFVRIKNGQQDKKSAFSGEGKGKKINLAPSYSADFSDDLWEVFAQCETYRDMVQCLKMAFNVLKKNEFPLFVRNDNDTLLARLVRQSSSGLTYFPPLTDLMPLKIVTELGLEHMKKIYTTILLSNELSISNDIDNFLKDSLKVDTNSNLSMSIIEPDHQMKESLLETVKKLHHCIDLVCLVDIQTENLQLKAVAGHILNHYRLNALDESYTFVIPLASRPASQEVERLSPCMVRREYKVGEQGRVECFVSEMPEELILQAHQQQVTSDMSINISDNSKECFKFTTEENVMILPRAADSQFS